MKLFEYMFRSKNEKYLSLLTGKIYVMGRGEGQQRPINFYCLGKDLETYRDLIRDHLDGLPTAERAVAEGQLWPGVKALFDKAGKLVDQAREGGIGEDQLSPLDRLLESILFVSAKTAVVV